MQRRTIARHIASVALALAIAPIAASAQGAALSPELQNVRKLLDK